MKKAFAVFLLSMGLAGNALAANEKLVADLAAKPDLSVFSQALTRSGILDQLNPNVRYTIFAPTNAAFARMLPKEQYPCFYSRECKTQIDDILRNHIVYDEHHITDVADHQGGLTAINGHLDTIGRPNPGVVTLAGMRVLDSDYFYIGVLTTIDGVILDSHQLAALHPLQDLAPAAGGNNGPEVVSVETNPNCDAEPGCFSQTRTIMETVPVSAEP